MVFTADIPDDPVIMDNVFILVILKVLIDVVDDSDVDFIVKFEAIFVENLDKSDGSDECVVEENDSVSALDLIVLVVVTEVSLVCSI